MGVMEKRTELSGGEMAEPHGRFVLVREWILCSPGIDDRGMGDTASLPSSKVLTCWQMRTC